MVVGDFDTNLDAPLVGDRYEGIEVALAEEGLEYISGPFIPGYNPCLKYGCTWDMHQDVRDVCSRTNYILGTDSCLLQNLSETPKDQVLVYFVLRVPYR